MTLHTPPPVGDDVLVVFEGAGERASVMARVTESTSDLLIVDILPPTTVPDTVPATVLAQSGERTRFASVVRVRRHGRTFHLVVGQWRSDFNRRNTPRYPVVLDCQVSANGETTPARCVDISVHGAAIEVNKWKAECFELQMEGLVVPCRAVAIEPLAMMDVVHVRFDQPNEGTAAAIQLLVERAHADFAEHQWQLVNRTNRRHDWTGQRVPV